MNSLGGVARELLAESRAVVEKRESASVALPEEANAALAQAADSAAMRSAETVQQGLASDIEGASLKARHRRLRVPCAVTGGNVDVDHRRHVVGGGVCGGLCHRALGLPVWNWRSQCED